MKLSFLKKNILIYFFWFISIIYLLNKFINDFNIFSEKIKIDFGQLFFVFFLYLIIVNINSFRFFFFLKKINKYLYFIGWSVLFFKTSVLNLFLQGSGHILRAIELKKKNVGYTDFVILNFFIIILNLFFYIFFFLILLYFIREEKIILLCFFFFIFFLFLVILKKKKIILILINFIKKKPKFFKNKFTFISNTFLVNFEIFFHLRIY